MLQDLQHEAEQIDLEMTASKTKFIKKQGIFKIRGKSRYRMRHIQIGTSNSHGKNKSRNIIQNETTRNKLRSK